MAEKKSKAKSSKSKDDETSIQVNIKPGRFKNEWKNEWKNECKSSNVGCHSGNVVYGMGFIGAAIYFISTAGSFWMGVLGFFKAIIWPVFLVYGLLKYLGL